MRRVRERIIREKETETGGLANVIRVIRGRKGATKHDSFPANQIRAVSQTLIERDVHNVYTRPLLYANGI